MPSTKRRPAAASHSHSSSADLLSESDVKEAETLLVDFDVQWSKILSDIEKQNEAHLESLASFAKMEMLKVPRNLRKKTVAEITAEGAKKQEAEEETTSTQPPMLKDAMAAVAEDVTSQVKRGLKSTRKRGAAAVARTRDLQTPMGPPPPSTGVRRSTRRRAPPANHAETPLNAPSASKRVASVVRGNVNNPFETPSFRCFTRHRASKADLMTPLSRSVLRAAKPGETLQLVSEKGSPIINGTYTATKKGQKRRTTKTAPSDLAIPLGDGRTVIVPFPAGNDTADVDGQPEIGLREEEKAKLLQVRNVLDKLIQPSK